MATIRKTRSVKKTATKTTKATPRNRVSKALMPPDGNGRAGRTAQAEKIIIPEPTIAYFKVTIVGITPLIQQRFSEKARTQIRETQQHKAKKPRGKRDPRAEYLAACYVMPGSEAGKRGCKYAIPAIQIKAAAVDACRFTDGLTMTMARCAFHVMSPDGGDLIQMKFKTMRMREDAVRLAGRNRVLDLRYRPEFDGWTCTALIRYNADAMSASQIVNLLSLAGFHCGLAELRPNSENGPGGSNGLFEVVAAK